jgi:hypothetical protein
MCIQQMRIKDYDIKDRFYEEIQQVFHQFPGYHMNIFLEDSNAEIGREDIFKPIIGNESLHEVSNDNGVKTINCAFSKNIIVKSTTSPHRDIIKHNWTSPNCVTQNQTDVLIDKRHSNASLLEVQFFRRADCDIGHYMVLTRLKERISVIKGARHRSNLEIFELRKLDDVEVKEKYQV